MNEQTSMIGQFKRKAPSPSYNKLKVARKEKSKPEWSTQKNPPKNSLHRRSKIRSLAFVRRNEMNSKKASKRCNLGLMLFRESTMNWNLLTANLNMSTKLNRLVAFKHQRKKLLVRNLKS